MRPKLASFLTISLVLGSFPFLPYLFDSSVSADITDSLIGHYQFNESTWTGAADEIKDVSGNDYTATRANAYQVTGRIDEAAYFDGTGDWIIVNDNTAFSFERTDTYTISFWVNTTSSLSLTRTIVSKMYNGGALSYRGWDVGMNVDGTLTSHLIGNWGTGSAMKVTGDTSIKDGSWHHVAVTYDGSSNASGLDITIDGRLNSMTLDIDNLTTTTINTNYPHIGTREGEGTYTFQGTVDDLRIYNRNLSQAEIDEVIDSAFDLNNQLYGHWKLDEDSWDGTSGEVLDSSGNARHGTSGNGATTTDSPSKYDRAGTFDATDDYVNLPNFGIPNNFSWGGWVNPGGSYSDLGDRIIDRWNGSSPIRGWSLTESNPSTGILVCTVSDDGTNSVAVSSNEAIPINAWTHVMCVRQGRDIKIYINGVLNFTGCLFLGMFRASKL